MSIDFSKAPDGATHYDFDSSSDVFWYKHSDLGWHFTWGSCKAWYLDESNLLGTKLVKISNPIDEALKEVVDILVAKKLTVTCDNERQKMLCEQVVRDYQGLRSQYRTGDGCEWLDVDSTTCLDYAFEYRAKPKKELVVPWNILSDEVKVIRVDSNGCIYDGNTPVRIKLDLDDIDLPVIVKRPKG